MKEECTVKIFKIGLLGLLSLVVSVSGLMAADAGWNKIGESKGIVGYTRPTPKSSIDEIMAVGVVDAPVAALEAILRDVPALKEFMFLCKEAFLVDLPGQKNTMDSYRMYIRQDLPVVSDRDCIARCDWSINPATNTLYCHGEGIKSDYHLEKDVVRMPLVTLDYTLVPKGPDKTEVTYLALAVPGGNLPSFVVNLLTKNLGIKTIAGLRDMAKKDKYKNAKTVVTTTAHK